MYTIRCTHILLKKLGLKPRDLPKHADPDATTCLGDWYANRLNVGHKRYILCTNDRSLLSLVVPAKDLPGLPARLARALESLLHSLGVPGPQISAELAHMQVSRYGPTRSRSILGSMNDFAWMAETYILRGGADDLNAVSMLLAQSPSGPIEYEFPGRYAAQLLSGCYAGE